MLWVENSVDDCWNDDCWNLVFLLSNEKTKDCEKSVDLIYLSRTVTSLIKGSALLERSRELDIVLNDDEAQQQCYY